MLLPPLPNLLTCLWCTFFRNSATFFDHSHDLQSTSWIAATVVSDKAFISVDKMYPKTSVAAVFKHMLIIKNNND